ncbi:MAG: carboxypeptidase-like regulatory domain-containing protein [Cytophagaceae bacterium]
MKKTFPYLLLILALMLSLSTSFAQNNRKIIQFSGLVVGGDSAYGIPGVHVFVPISGRGTVTSHLGYFSMPTMIGDSVVIRSIGYKEKHFIIPYSENDNLSVIIQLSEDTTLLPDVSVFPWPTEQIFKEAFLALRLPEADMDAMHKNLNDQVMKRMMYNTSPDGMMVHKYYMEQQIQRTDTRYMANSYAWQNLTNPFAWARFIKEVKKGGLKNKDYQQYTPDVTDKEIKKNEKQAAKEKSKTTKDSSGN